MGECETNQRQRQRCQVFLCHTNYESRSRIHNGLIVVTRVGNHVSQFSSVLYSTPNQSTWGSSFKEQTNACLIINHANILRILLIFINNSAPLMRNTGTSN